MRPPAIRLCPPDAVEILDQTQLPLSATSLVIADVELLCEAIASLRIRGAPLLGLAGAAGLAIAASKNGPEEQALTEAAHQIASTRPTAVDLGRRVYEALAFALARPVGERRTALWEHAERLHRDRLNEDTALSENGAEVLGNATSVLTHCNTGELATGGKGTAFGVIEAAWQAGNLERCYVTETRPLLQGARLTTWELQQAGIPTTLLPDTAVGSLLSRGFAGAVITGADRIAANGDTANKIGTYQLAVLAKRHDVPFYIAAPLSTVDLACPDGSAIPIEMRPAEEVGGFAGTRWSAHGIEAFNPAFDVTPADLITAIITERGVARPPFAASIADLDGERQEH